MQRRYPGRYGERGIPDDPARWPEEDPESARRRSASENVGAEDWGSEWTERAARPADQRRGMSDPDRQGVARSPAWEAERGYREPGRRAEGSEGPHGGDRPEFRGHFRMGRYGDEHDHGDPRDTPRHGGYAPDPSRYGGDADRDALRHRRGPKGYTRSDERIREDVCERLAHALDIDVSDVTVQVQDGCVVLDGTVPSRWMKHDIEDLADGCMGVRDVENRVRVHRDGEHDTGMVLHPDQRTITPTLPAARDPEPGTVEREREREPHH
ncbi:BON domain-containing protein [Burkholderia cepacia]|uniref:BON domain-containing protein n=1 Tax=Burkholderia cepacia TaxID=292 RepID=UPI001CF534AB|nr:BON domain-containing protein [Burkholderia cepacia]MCA8281383.1 BON domain-containing protein [Burkholderia cepacia]